MNIALNLTPQMASPSVDMAAAEAFLAECYPARRLDRVLFITPPDGEAELFRLATARRRRYPNYPPYGQAVLAANLRQIGVDCRILNLNHEVLKAACSTAGDDFDFDRIWQDCVRDTLDAFKPGLIGVTCMFTMTHASMKRVCEFLEPFGIPIAIGGVHVTNDADRVLDDIPSVRVALRATSRRASQVHLPSFSSWRGEGAPASASRLAL